MEGEEVPLAVPLAPALLDTVPLAPCRVEGVAEAEAPALLLAPPLPLGLPRLPVATPVKEDSAVMVAEWLGERLLAGEPVALGEGVRLLLAEGVEVTLALRVSRPAVAEGSGPEAVGERERLEDTLGEGVPEGLPAARRAVAVAAPPCCPAASTASGVCHAHRGAGAGAERGSRAAAAPPPAATGTGCGAHTDRGGPRQAARGTGPPSWRGRAPPPHPRAATGRAAA